MISYRRYLIVAMLILLPQFSFASSQPITINTDGNIPTITYINKAYSVTYTLTNTLDFNMPTPLAIEKIASSNNFFITDTCTNKALLKNQHCKINVVFTPSHTGKQSLKLLMDFAHYRVPFANIIAHSKTEIVINKENSIPLAPNLAIGIKYPLQFTFTNPTSNPPITHLITILSFPNEFKLSENTCDKRSTLVGGLSCYITGNIIPTHTGSIAIKTTLQYTEGRAVSIQTKGSAENVVVTGDATTKLDTNTDIDTEYPVQLTFMNTSANVDASDLKLTTDFDHDFSVKTNTCQDISTLSPLKACYISGELLPITPNNHTIAATLKYAEGQPVTAQTNTSAEDVVVTGNVTRKLDENVAVGIKYPTQITFTNTSPNIAATAINLTYNFPTSFKLDKNTCATKGSLAHGESCYISGNITPTKIGPITVAATLKYAEGQPVTTQTTTSAENVVVIGDTTKKPDANVAVNSKYPVQLTFTNTSANLAAYNLTLNTNFPEEFKLDENTCINKKSLAKLGSCYIKGSITPTKTGPITVAATLNYAEGQPVTAQMTTSAENVVVTGSATTKLDQNIAMGIKYPVQLTFTNTSANVAATQLNFLPKFDNDFSVNTNTCQDITILEPTKSCYVSGELTPTTANNHTVAATLNYAEGQPITATTSASAENVIVTGKATINLDQNIAVGVEYPVQLTFTNTSKNLAATQLHFSAKFDSDFKMSENNCSEKPELSPNQSCFISGILKPTTTSTHTVATIMTYAQGQPVIAQTSASAENVVVTGDATTKLDQNVAVGIAHPIQLTFTNTSANIDATNLKLTTNFPENFTPTENTCKGKMSLAKNNSCYISGEIIAKKNGPLNIAATLYYKEGQPVTAQTSTSAENVVVTGNTTTKLNQNVAVGIKYPVRLTFINTSANLAANNVSLNTNFPTDFKLNENTCANKTTLASKQYCFIEGSITPTKTGPLTVEATLKYTEGQPITATTSTSAENVVVTGKTETELPAVIAPNFNYPIKFIFTNTSTNLAATGLNFSNAFPTGFSIDENTCAGKNSLDINSSCSLTGQLNTKKDGPLSIGITLQYKEGQPISLQTETNVEILKLIRTEPLGSSVRFGNWLKFYLIFNRKVERGEFSLISNRILTNGYSWAPNNASQFYLNNNKINVDDGMNQGEHLGNSYVQIKYKLNGGSELVVNSSEFSYYK